MSKIPFTSPKFKLSAFNCPYCSAYSDQRWFTTITPQGDFLEETHVCFCSHCNKYSIWFKGSMIYPDFSGIEPPNADLNKDIVSDYNEAVSILQRSPRGSAALLRLAIQKLCVQLGENGKNLNTDIANLVKKGLPSKVQESLDSLRVIGNESVHPGELNMKDDVATATALFRLVNFIAEKMITEPKEIEAIYNKLPESKKKEIANRDKVKKQ